VAFDFREVAVLSTPPDGIVTRTPYQMEAIKIILPIAERGFRVILAHVKEKLQSW
jgi:hypothetical protein